MNQYNTEFWNALDELVNNSEIIIDRPKGSAHPKYPDFIYRVDYGYLTNTSSMDGAGIDVWVGSGERKVDAVMCIVDLKKKDSEIKILIGCTEEEKSIVYEAHNKHHSLKGILIRRAQDAKSPHNFESDEVYQMIDITAWMTNFQQALYRTFANRVWFVGLQGSYGRGEANQTSDIDVVVILDEMSAMDIQTYNDMLDTLPHRELICGFISGKKEILNWASSDLFQFCSDTTPIQGSLDEVLSVVDESAVRSAIKIGACNIFHGCVHNMLHEKSEDILRGLYKSASFVVQAIAFSQTGNYIRHQKDLLQVVSADEKAIVDTFLRLKNGEPIVFNPMSEALFTWSKKWIAENPDQVSV